MLACLNNRWIRLMLSVLICVGLPAVGCCFSGKIDSLVILGFFITPAVVTAFGCALGMRKESRQDWPISLSPVLVSALLLVIAGLLHSAEVASSIRFIGLFALIMSALHCLQMCFFAVAGRRDLLVSWWAYFLSFALCALVGCWVANLTSAVFWVICILVSLLCALLAGGAEGRMMGAGVGIAVWLLLSGVILLLYSSAFVAAELTWKLVIHATSPGLVSLLTAVVFRKTAGQTYKKLDNAT